MRTIGRWGVVLLLLAGCAELGDAAEPVGTVPGGPGEIATVASITDGDTFRTTDDVRVRFIGIDTPEVTDDECFADEATAALEALIPPGTDVRLVVDAEPLDRYGRTLAYVERAEDDLDVGLQLARDGFAVQLTVPPNVARVDAIGAAVAEARDADRGLWAPGACAERESIVGATVPPPTTTAPPTTVPPTLPPTTAAPPPPTTSPPPPPTAPPVQPVAGGQCDPSYPDVCIPPAPPDLDCPEIPHRRFAVIGADPHGFDGDHDGIGCESD